MLHSDFWFPRALKYFCFCFEHSDNLISMTGYQQNIPQYIFEPVFKLYHFSPWLHLLFLAQLMDELITLAAISLS